MRSASHHGGDGGGEGGGKGGRGERGGKGGGGGGGGGGMAGLGRYTRMAICQWVPIMNSRTLKSCRLDLGVVSWRGDGKGGGRCHRSRRRWRPAYPGAPHPNGLTTPACITAGMLWRSWPARAECNQLQLCMHVAAPHGKQ